MAEANVRPPPPEWLNGDLVLVALRKAAGDEELSVESLDVRHACLRGTGLLSEMYRVTAGVRRRNGGVERRSLLVKSLLRSGRLLEATQEADIFQKERLMYTAMLRLTEPTLRAEAGDDWRPLAAKCHHSDSQPTDYLVLEDLSEDGFQLVGSGHLLDRQHCSLVLRRLATLHATSLLLRENESFLTDAFIKHPFLVGSVRDHFSVLSKKMLSALADTLEIQTGYEKFAQKYRQMRVNIFDRMESLLLSSRSQLTVLNHGDLWKNNIMFKYDDGFPVDVRLVDFQVSFWGSPAMDIHHLLGSSATVGVHLRHKDELLQEYHRTLLASMRALGLHQQADGFPLRQLRREMEHLDEYSLVIASMMPPIILAPESLGKDAEDAMNNEDNADTYFRTITANSTYMSHITSLLSDTRIGALML